VSFVEDSGVREFLIDARGLSIVIRESRLRVSGFFIEMRGFLIAAR
jgi:hypothetical protein